MGFADDFDRSARQEVPASVNAAVRDGAKRFGRILVDRTPEDEGDAKGGWTAAKRTRRRFKRGTSAESKAPSNEAEIDGTDFFAGESITWSNGAPYIWVLEHGSSDQAPSGMLGVTAAEWPRILRDMEVG